jgi:hypothetical protein
MAQSFVSLSEHKTAARTPVRKKNGFQATIDRMLPYSLTTPDAIRYIACMQTLMAVCLVLLVLELGVITIAVMMVCLQIRRTTRSIEVLTCRVDDQVAAVEEIIYSGWARISQAVVSRLSRWLCKN